MKLSTLKELYMRAEVAVDPLIQKLVNTNFTLATILILVLVGVVVGSRYL